MHNHAFIISVQSLSGRLANNVNFVTSADESLCHSLIKKRSTQEDCMRRIFAIKKHYSHGLKLLRIDFETYFQYEAKLSNVSNSESSILAGIKPSACTIRFIRALVTRSYT